MTASARPKLDADETPRRLLIPRLLSWLMATQLLGFSPIVYVIARLGDDATEASTVEASAVPVVMAAPLLLLAASLARNGRRRRIGPALVRTVALIAYAVAALALARQLGTTRAIFGDTAWTAYWTAAFAGWVALSVVCLRRPPPQDAA
jgi:hypothetical protein